MEPTEDFSAFVRRAWPGLVRTATLLTGDVGQAQELVQEALVRAYGKWRSIRRSDRPEVYVHRVLVNVHRSWWRRHRREQLVDRVPDRPDPAAGPPDLDARLDRVLAGLPARMRATLVLRFYHDLSEQQVADALGCSLGSVKSQTSRGLARLRAALAETEPALTTEGRQ